MDFYFISNFDLLVVLAIIIFNILFWKKKSNTGIGCAIGFLLMIVLPLISQFEEIQRYTADKEIVDSFELLYTYLKFPFYWTVGFIQVLILQLKNGKKKGASIMNGIKMLYLQAEAAWEIWNEE